MSCVELVMQKVEGMVIGSTIGELVKLSFSDFEGKSNYGHLQISGVPNSRDHRLETTPPDDTIYSVSQSRWRPVPRFVLVISDNNRPIGNREGPVFRSFAYPSHLQTSNSPFNEKISNEFF